MHAALIAEPDRPRPAHWFETIQKLAHPGWIGGPADEPIVVQLGYSKHNTLVLQVMWLTFAKDVTSEPTIAFADLICHPAAIHMGFQPVALWRIRPECRRNSAFEQVAVELGVDPTIRIGNRAYGLRPMLISHLGSVAAGMVIKVDELDARPHDSIERSYLLIQHDGQWAFGQPDAGCHAMTFRKPTQASNAEPAIVIPIDHLKHL